MDSDELQLESVKQAIAGDRTALKLLLAESHVRLARYLGDRIPADVQSVVGADDILQDAHVEVFRRIHAFEPRGPDSFHRWVASIALSRLRNCINRHKAIKRGGDRRQVGSIGNHPGNSTFDLFNLLAGSGRTPSRSMARGEAIRAVQLAMDELPEHYKRAVWLVHIEGRTVKEAAAEMHRTERAIHGLCRRAMTRLQKHLGHASRFLSSSD